MLLNKRNWVFNSKLNVCLVFNTHFNGLGVIRSLALNDIPVIALDCSLNSLGRYTKFASFYKIPDPRVQEKEFIKNLIEFGKNFKLKPVLFPTNDIWSIPISKYRELISRYFITYNPPYDVLEIIINKKLFYQWCINNDFEVPRTYQYSDIKYLMDRDFPLVIKPISRELSSDNLYQKDKSKEYNKNRLITIEGKEQLNSIAKQFNEEEYLLQEKVNGSSANMYTVGVYADSGSNVLGLFCGKKVRGYPYEYGDCMVGESNFIEELAETTIELVKKIKYTGIAEIEFKKDDNTGEYKLIEINPRTWSWIGVVPYANVNLPFIAYNDLVNKAKPEGIVKSVDRILWVRLVDDVINSLFLYPEENRKSLLSLIKEYKKYEKVVIAETGGKDYIVLFYYLFLKIKNRFSEILRRLRKIKNHDISFNSK